ncbi:MAG: hypothetical protein ACOC2W_01905 [bacterium]
MLTENKKKQIKELISDHFGGIDITDVIDDIMNKVEDILNDSENDQSFFENVFKNCKFSKEFILEKWCSGCLTNQQLEFLMKESNANKQTLSNADGWIDLNSCQILKREKGVLFPDEILKTKKGTLIYKHFDSGIYKYKIPTDDDLSYFNDKPHYKPEYLEY